MSILIKFVVNILYLMGMEYEYIIYHLHAVTSSVGVWHPGTLTMFLSAHHSMTSGNITGVMMNSAVVVDKREFSNCINIKPFFSKEMFP